MFKKNDKVVVISSWNNRGAMRLRRAVVHSCGKQVMRLQYESGEMFKAAFSPENNVVHAFNSFVVVADDDTKFNAEYEATALEHDRQIIDLNVARCERNIAGSSNPSYIASITKDLDELKTSTPTFLWFSK